MGAKKDTLVSRNAVKAGLRPRIEGIDALCVFFGCRAVCLGVIRVRRREEFTDVADLQGCVRWRGPDVRIVGELRLALSFFRRERPRCGLDSVRAAGNHVGELFVALFLALGILEVGGGKDS